MPKKHMVKIRVKKIPPKIKLTKMRTPTMKKMAKMKKMSQLLTSFPWPENSAKEKTEE